MSMQHSIGEVARQTGATPKAIRLYEAEGLIPPPARRGRYRVYADADIAQIRLIRQAQALGFRLKEIAPLLRAHPEDGPARWQLAQQLIAAKRAAIEAELEALRQRSRLLATLEAEIAECLLHAHSG